MWLEATVNLRWDHAWFNYCYFFIPQPIILSCGATKLARDERPRTWLTRTTLMIRFKITIFNMRVDSKRGILTKFLDTELNFFWRKTKTKRIMYEQRCNSNFLIVEYLLRYFFFKIRQQEEVSPHTSHLSHEFFSIRVC